MYNVLGPILGPVKFAGFLALSTLRLFACVSGEDTGKRYAAADVTTDSAGWPTVAGCRCQR